MTHRCSSGDTGGSAMSEDKREYTGGGRIFRAEGCCIIVSELHSDGTRRLVHILRQDSPEVARRGAKRMAEIQEQWARQGGA